MIFPSRSQLASQQITRTGRAGAVEGLAATLLPARQSGDISFMLAERHPIAAGKRGVLKCLTAPGGRIGGLGLQFDASGRFVSIPKLTTSQST